MSETNSGNLQSRLRVVEKELKVAKEEIAELRKKSIRIKEFSPFIVIIKESGCEVESRVKDGEYVDMDEAIDSANEVVEYLSENGEKENHQVAIYQLKKVVL